MVNRFLHLQAGKKMSVALVRAISAAFSKTCLVAWAEWAVVNRITFSPANKSIRRPAGATQTGTVNVKIPAGIEPGKKIRLSGQGKAGMSGKPGDLYLEIQIAPHSLYRLEGKDVYLDLPISPWEAALGAKITAPTLAGKISLNIPAGTRSGQKMRLKGRGLPAKTPGDQFVVLQIMTPPATTAEAKKFYQQMAEKLPFNPRENIE